MNSIEKHRSAAKVLPDGELRIGGDIIRDSSGPTLEHVNPSTGEPQKSFTCAGAKEVDLAVKAAAKALPGWRAAPPAQRRDMLQRIALLFEQDSERLGILGALDNGTPVVFGELLSSASPADWFRYYAGWADKLSGHMPPQSSEHFLYSSREPYGVIAAIVAYNAPMAFMGLKVAAALAAGNTVVIKPSELAPWSVLRFAEICAEAGLPDGVVSIVPGDANTGNALINHPLVNKITFTGGDATARRIMAAAAEQLKPVSLELGGKSASIICQDADLERAVPTALQTSVVIQSGQACVAGSRLLVQKSTYKDVVDRLTQAAGAFSVGDPLAGDTLMGPVVSEKHCLRILSVIERAKADGDGRLVYGGNRLSGPLSGGFFLEPTLFVDVDANSSLAQDEVFGPVLAVIPYDTDEQAVAIANSSRYGLSGYVFTENLSRAHSLSRAIEAGTIGVNSPNLFSPVLPFGGIKASGFGREGGYDGIFDMTYSKAVQIAL